MSSDDLPYRAEYAKSGRASCKGCKSNIAKETLRLAVMVQSHHFDGKVPNWYHSTCFFGKQRPKAVADIAHFDSLRWDDQEKLKTKLAEVLNTAVEAPKKGRKRANAKAVKGALKDFTIEYAKSSRAMCRGCEIKISKDEVRVSKKDFESEGAKQYGGQDRWHHVECFAKLRGELEFFESGDVLPGFETLKKEDKEIVKKALPKIDPPVKDEVDGEAPLKKLKKEELPSPEEDEKLKKQNKMIYKFHDSLKSFSKSQLTSLLEHNDQEVPPGVDRILERLSDCMAFGALAKCTMCKKGQLVYKSGRGYVCKGDLTEWTKCTHSEATPQRVKFTIPEELKEEPFLSSYKCKLGTRIVQYNQPTATSNSSVEPGPSQPKVERFAPFRDMTFFIAGKLSKKAALVKKEIESLGGTVPSKLTENVVAVISNEDEVEEMSKHIEKAKALNIHVVPESYIETCKDPKEDPVENIVKLSICSWGRNPKAKVDEKKSKSMASKSGKSGSMFTKSVPTKVTLKLKGGVAVDPDSNLEDEAHVYKKGDEVYNAVLSKTDLQSGKNSYYKLQVLVSDRANKFWLFRSWGRIGTTIGNTKLEKMGNLQDAKTEFKRLFLEKTGNDFKDRQNFVKMPNLFYPIEVDYGNESVKLSTESKFDSKLSKPVQELVTMLFDVDLMKKVMMEFELDLEKMPLGKLSKGQIQKAYSILAELEKLEGDVKPHLVLDASNRFYTLIPHSFGVENPPLLDNKEIIKSKLEMLESLMEMELAYSLLKETGGEGDEGLHPVDIHYSKLNSEIEVLEKSAEEFELLQQYVDNTHAETHTSYKLEIQEVFKVRRNGEEKRFKPFKKLHNRKLLWHGSRVTNFAGILSQGLRIAPPEAPVTGYMFGKGIYFADMVTKSANYCMTTPGNNQGLLLLCEVALGDMYERTQADYITKLPKGKHSTKGVGATAPDPASSQTLDGAELPLGKPVKAVDNSATSLLYNEYIVYDVAQVKAKYLLKVNFNYNY